jgi:hypothetical protein
VTLADYIGLITSWHSDKPKFVNTVATLVQPLVDAQDMLAKLTADFDLDTAVGVQLDQVGQWIGRTRYIQAPIKGVFFSFNDGAGPRTGFNQGIWLGAYDPIEGIIALDDDTYRAVLKLLAIANQWDGTVPSIADDLDRVFPGTVIQDLGDTPPGRMAMDVLIPGVLINSLLLSVLEQDFPVKPAGVHVNFIESTVSTQQIFAFNVDGATGGPLGGFNQGAWGVIVLTT